MHRDLVWARAGVLTLVLLSSTHVPTAAAPPSAAAAIVDGLAVRLANVADYRADLELHVRMRHFPFIRASFRGSITFNAPDTFSVSLRQHSLAQSYQRAMTEMGDPGAWLRSYDISIDAGAPQAQGQITLLLLPRGVADNDRIVVDVDQTSRTIQRIEWFFKDGGRVSMTQQYVPIGGSLMITHQDIDIVTHDANVTAQADLRNYSIEPLAAF